jgi:hypothetical protein
MPRGRLLAVSGRHKVAGMAATCDFCGAIAPAGPDDSSGETSDVLPLTWTTAVENGRQRVFCESCSREHLRAIESKLDSEWW